MSDEEKYIPPTLEDVKRIFGDRIIGEPFKVPVRHCRDVQKFISKFNDWHRRTKKTCIQFD